MTRDVLLEVEGLNLAIDGAQGRQGILYDIDLRLARGETLCLVGESGSGKSMTGLALMGLAPASARITGGSIRLGGVELVGAREEQLRRIRGRRIAMIFQEPMTALNPVLPIGLQITKSLREHRIVARGAEHARAIELLQSVGITDPARRLHEYPHQLSGGMRQRVMIAIALAGEPEVLIADEPTTALDVTVQAQVLDLLRTLQARLGLAIILVTHDMGVVAEVADRVSVMYAGRKVEDGTLAQVLSRDAHPYTRALVACMPRRQRRGAGPRAPLTEIPGVVPSPTAMPTGCRFHPRCPYAIDECATTPVELTTVADGHRSRCIRVGDLALEGAR